MKRAERVAQIRALQAQGLTHAQIAAELGVTYSTVTNALYDPDGSKQRARRVRYQGSCVDCGGPTDGSDGRAHAAKRCHVCRKAFGRATKMWTRERIIDAIQRFAAEYGRPPTAREWQRPDRRRGYPYATSCYRNHSSPNAPFAKWADAIEAAGFPRPRAGHYQDESKRRAPRKVAA